MWTQSLRSLLFGSAAVIAATLAAHAGPTDPSISVGIFTLDPNGTPTVTQYPTDPTLSDMPLLPSLDEAGSSTATSLVVEAAGTESTIDFTAVYEYYDIDSMPTDLEWADDTGADFMFEARYFISPTLIPLDQLNGDLPGFGPAGPPLFVSPSQTADEELPEPGAITLLASSLAALALIRRKRAAG